MKKRLMIVLLMCMTVGVVAQEGMLKWTELMSAKYYPQRQMRGFKFLPNSDKVMYMKDTSVYVLDGKRERLATEKEREFYKEKKKEPHKIEHHESGMNYRGTYATTGGVYVDGELFWTGVDGYEYTFGEPVHRHEFGINEGVFWSKSGNRMAFYIMDQSMVADYPLVQTQEREAEASYIKYPMAGMKSHEVEVWVHDFTIPSDSEDEWAFGPSVKLQTRMDTTVHEREMYLTNIAFSPDEKHVFIAKVNREQNHMWFEMYNTATGEYEKTLFEERNERYVEPCDAMIFTPKGNQFLWFSMRDGYKHLYLYNIDGTLVRQVTTGNYEVEGFIKFDPKGENIYVYANKDNLSGRAVYKVNIKNGKMTAVTPTEGTHSVVINDDCTRIVDMWSSVSVPASAELRDGNGRLIKNLYEAENPITDNVMPGVELGTIKAADGRTDLYYRLITPPMMEKGKRYPTLVYVYGGPHSQLVTDSWLAGANLYFLFLAQQGYVVFTLDNRGTDNRGFEFESCTHRQLGTLELADQMEGVKFLQGLPYVDKERMGVEGWSFGGFMTLTMKLAHPEVFKVGCAGGPVVDWKWYEIMYGERYMDMPQENPEGYEKASLLNKAQNLQGRLLVMHGAQDDVVMWQNSLEFVERCINNFKQVDYFVYPHHKHNVLGKERLHLYKKMFDYYESYLK